MKKLLIAESGEPDIKNLPQDLQDYDVTTLDLSFGYDVAELMDLYEVIKPELCDKVRQELIIKNYDLMIVLGRSEEYLWNGTVIARLFGQFSSWNDQRENPYGITSLSVNGQEVPLAVLENLEDWEHVPL